MADDIQEFALTCEGGLDTKSTYIEQAVTAPGSATQLLNFEPSIFGGYRRIEGFAPLNVSYETVDSSNAEGPILGVMIYNDEIYTARKQQSGTTYKIYKYDSGSGWVAQTTGAFTLNTTSGGYSVTRLDYRAFSMDGVKYLLFCDGVNNATLFDGTTWAQIDSADTGAAIATSGGNQAIDRPSRVEIYNGHVFLSGDPADPGVIVYSAPQKPFDYAVADGAGQIIPGYQAHTIKVWRDFLYAFGYDNIGYVTVSGTDFVFKNVSTQIGCIAPWSIVELDSNLIYLSQDGFRSVEGTDKINDVNVGIISKKVHKLTKELNDTYTADGVVGYVIPSKSQARFFWTSSGTETASTRGVLVGIRENQAGEKIKEWAEMLGIQPWVATYGRINNVEYIIHGDYSGNVYRQEQGNDFNGENIIAVYSTPHLYFTSPMLRKTLRKIYAWIEATEAVDITTTMSFNWGSQEKLVPEATELDSTGTAGSTYDSGVVYGGVGVTYGGNLYPLFDKNINGTCKAVRFSFATNGTEAPYSIQSIILEYTEEGRR